jgi:hypothetical protein
MADMFMGLVCAAINTDEVVRARAKVTGEINTLSTAFTLARACCPFHAVVVAGILGIVFPSLACTVCALELHLCLRPCHSVVKFQHNTPLVWYWLLVIEI